ncbi:MAG: GAF domain-containing protein [Anaerolineales bacterium]|nr:GAF domain-containing protein [Anaerolineales bacterium]
MDPQLRLFGEQLDQIRLTSGASWAACLSPGEQGWRISSSTRLAKARRKAIESFLQEAGPAGWLSGALQSGRVRSRSLEAASSQLGCRRVFAFPGSSRRTILLVGADGLSSENQTFYRILALGAPGMPLEPASLILPVHAPDSHPAPELVSSYDAVLVELARAAACVEDTAEIAMLVIEKLCVLFKTDRASVLLLSADGKRLREYASQSGSYPLVLPVAESLAGLVVEAGRSLRFGRFEEIPRYYDDPKGTNSVMAAPLKNRNQVIGVLMVESPNLDFYTLNDEDMLQVVASILAGVMINLDFYKETRQRQRNLELIHQVLEQVVGMNDEAEIAQTTAELMAEYFGYEFSLILVSDPPGLNLVNLGVSGTKRSLIERGYAYSVEQGITGRVYRSGMSYFSNDVSQDPGYLPIPGWEGGSEICVPLRDGERVFGVINLENSHKQAFLESDQILVETLAGILSSLMTNARRYQALRRNLSQLSAVRKTALDISADLDLDTLLKRIVHRACELVHARGAEIGLLDEDQPGIRVQTSENPWYDFTGHFIPLGKGVAGQVLLHGHSLRVADYNRWSERLWPSTQVEFKSAAGIPLLLKGQVIGTLVVMDDDPVREFTEEDIETLELIARNISLAIQNARLYRELQERIDALRQAENRLVQSERIAVAGRLTASIAHEINNPLQALQNCLYLADRNDLSSANRKKYLSMARAEMERLVSTVQRMLDFYRPGVRDRQATDINQLITRIIALVEPQLTRNKIQVTTELAPGLPQVMVVPSQIQQVLLNLILNSMEAMPNGGLISLQTVLCESITPTRRKSRKPSRPVGVEILLSDSGPGISSAERERIFEPFYSSKDSGLGLGLSVSYGIIQAHGGMLSVVSKPQPGACFRIALPEENSHEIQNISG